MRERLKREDGFNLLELVIVSLILAILIAIAVLSYIVPSNNARTITCEANQRTFTSAVTIYRTENGVEPTDVYDLEPYIEQFAQRVECTNNDGVELEYQPLTGIVTCDNHPR